MNPPHLRDVGPASELTFWTSRMRSLVSIQEQQRSGMCRAVIGCLTSVEKRSGADVATRHRL